MYNATQRSGVREPSRHETALPWCTHGALTLMGKCVCLAWFLTTGEGRSGIYARFPATKSLRQDISGGSMSCPSRGGVNSPS